MSSQMDIPELEEDEIDNSPAVPDSPFEMSDPFEPSKIQIHQKAESLHSLIERIRHEEIDMNTDFQRHADLWSPAKMSRLIESILIRFPLPAFYFDASDENRWLIVDGLQRLSSLKKFVLDNDLPLCGLEYLRDLHGKTYSELHRQYQRRIDECQATLFLIQPGTPDEVKYSVFRRINTGGLVLNNQEIRNAMASPAQRKYLERLAQDPNMIATMGDQSKRMLDQELVLRFIAFYLLDFQKSRKNIAEFLDEAMAILKEAGEEQLNELEKAFRRAIGCCNSLFMEKAFEKRGSQSPGGRRRKNSSLFEAWTVNLAHLDDAQMDILIRHRALLNQKANDLLADENSNFFRAISMATQKRENVQIRHDIVRKIIEEVLHA